MKTAIDILTERMNKERELAENMQERDDPDAIYHFIEVDKFETAIEVLKEHITDSNQEAEKQSIEVPPCPYCGSNKTYLTEAIHCPMCATTTEI